MKSQAILLGLICLRLGSVGTHPMENNFAAKFDNPLRNVMRDLDLFDKLLSFEKQFENVYISDEGLDLSAEKSPCINLGNDGCLNGYIIGSGGNKGFLGGAGSPGK